MSFAVDAGEAREIVNDELSPRADGRLLAFIARAERIEAALRDVEWSRGGRCPSCLVDAPGPHDPTCALDRALRCHGGE